MNLIESMKERYDKTIEAFEGKNNIGVYEKNMKLNDRIW